MTLSVFQIPACSLEPGPRDKTLTSTIVNRALVQKSCLPVPMERFAVSAKAAAVNCRESVENQRGCPVQFARVTLLAYVHQGGVCRPRREDGCAPFAPIVRHGLGIHGSRGVRPTQVPR